MAMGFLLSRVLMQFENDSDDLICELSAAALTPDGSLWVGSDEFLTLERLTPIEPYVYGNHKSFFVGDFVELFNTEDEIDIEGMDYSDGALWLVGSHSTKRNKPKGKKVGKDLKRLAEIKTDANRYLLARIPIIDGEPFKSYAHPDAPEKRVTAAMLEKTDAGNALVTALENDPHLGPFLSFPMPSKENGFDVEGLVVHGDRIFLGLRGPVLNGWAMILDIEVKETEPGVLSLAEISESQAKYRKHFIDLNGLGVRELCRRGDDLIILAGPTMDLEGAMKVFLWKDALNHEGDSVSDREAGDLELLFDIPFTLGGDHAEGLTLFPCLGYEDALLIVFDTPHAERRARPNAVFADVFRLDRPHHSGGSR